MIMPTISELLQKLARKNKVANRKADSSSQLTSQEKLAKLKTFTNTSIHPRIMAIEETTASKNLWVSAPEYPKGFELSLKIDGKKRMLSVVDSNETDAIWVDFQANHYKEPLKKELEKNFESLKNQILNQRLLRKST